MKTMRGRAIFLAQFAGVDLCYEIHPGSAGVRCIEADVESSRNGARLTRLAR